MQVLMKEDKDKDYLIEIIRELNKEIERKDQELKKLKFMIENGISFEELSKYYHETDRL